MERAREILKAALPDMVLIAGAVVLTMGVGMIYLPAGLIVGGGLMMTGALLAGGDT